MSQVFQSFRDSIINLAQEEEARRGQQPTKKKKKRQFEAKQINCEQVVLFDFSASAEYPEQITVVADEVVFTVQSFTDGWSQINKNDRLGVVPTTFLGEKKSEEQVKAKLSRGNSRLIQIRDKIVHRIGVLAKMGAQKSLDSATTGVENLYVGFTYFISNVVIPMSRHMFLILTRNESYTTVISSLIRHVYEYSSATLIPMLSDAELASYSKEINQDSKRVKAEMARRRKETEIKSRSTSLRSEGIVDGAVKED